MNKLDVHLLPTMIQQHCCIIAIKKHRVIIGVESGVWYNRAFFFTPQILAAINEKFAVKEIVFWIVPSLGEKNMKRKELNSFLNNYLKEEVKVFMKEIASYYAFIQKRRSARRSVKDDWQFLLGKKDILQLLLDNDETVVRIKTEFFQFNKDNEGMFELEDHEGMVDFLWDEFSFSLDSHVGDSDGVILLLEELGFKVSRF